MIFQRPQTVGFGSKPQNELRGMYVPVGLTAMIFFMCAYVFPFIHARIVSLSIYVERERCVQYQYMHESASAVPSNSSPAPYDVQDGAT
jgi:hypothetical protein